MFDNFGPLVSNNIELSGDKPFLAKSLGFSMVILAILRTVVEETQVEATTIFLFGIIAMSMLGDCIREER